MTESHFRPIGTRIGILGGGQLARMLSLAASRLGMKTHIFCPDPLSPAFEVTPHRTVADYEDRDALARFAAEVDIVTYEFENVPLATAAFLAGLRPLMPNARALAVAQDRLAEKRFLADAGIAIAPFAPVGSLGDFEAALGEIGIPCVLKTTRLGYDGKGQRMIRSGADAMPAYADLGGTDLVLERLVPFEREISVVVARAGTGETRAFDPAENVHRDHMLFTSTVPAGISETVAEKARIIAADIAEVLDFVGVLGVEFFVATDTTSPALLVNEIAPRVHNSGHWTEAVCLTDQFEQHIRAICGWPLGDPARMADVRMVNLVGDEIEAVADMLEPGDAPHVYGKSQPRPGRKMGHLNRVTLRR
ncbi:MAG: 5-(carboxyamino)imidazole ribonucleotide synthase [Alphaproteobacteria bacterium]|nr:5-(carboxyamino)imidazole ribonucleotide synthase [Alphaproteobacteria bacterium]